jgi:hypothetical protein
MSAHLALPASLSSIYKLAFPHCALSSVAFVLSRDDGTDAGDGRGPGEGTRDPVREFRFLRGGSWNPSAGWSISERIWLVEAGEEG